MPLALATFDNAPALDRALADTVAARLAAAINARGTASLVVSGGRPPSACLNSCLAQRCAGMPSPRRKQVQQQSQPRWTAWRAPHARMSLSLKSLLDSRSILVQITGATKRSVIERAAEPGPAETMPFRSRCEDKKAFRKLSFCDSLLRDS